MKKKLTAREVAAGATWPEAILVSFLGSLVGLLGLDILHDRIADPGHFVQFFTFAVWTFIGIVFFVEIMKIIKNFYRKKNGTKKQF